MTATKKYYPKEIEGAWAKKWYENNLYEAIDFSDRPKKYILAEFPYPSGKALHAGHMLRYTVPDVYARFLRMSGYNVLFPMGWDAFGLPTENYAVETGIHPAETTKEAIKNYKISFKKMGYGIDWTREINTTDPTYYKWTQWLFLKFWEEGLAELREMPIWWCEKLRTVLSDEEVLTDKEENKISERGEHPVEKRMLKQWVLKITKYADKLIDGLEETDFPEAIKKAQINWIGRKEGASVEFEIENHSVEVFTTRPDTLFGATFLVLAPEHPLVKTLTDVSKNKKEIKEYLKKASNKSDLEKQSQEEKTGVQFEGIVAKSPFTDIEREIPVFVADYVLTDYGTGAVMGVPAHDQRDFDFAKKYDLEIIQVIKPKDGMIAKPLKEAYEEKGVLINSGKFNNLGSDEASEEIIKELGFENKGRKETTYKLRDWIFSRQRYWGEPIPLIHTENGKIEPICATSDAKGVSENLPLKLPEVPEYKPSADGTSPLSRNKEWVQTTDKNGNSAKRETNTMPNWAGSCWYYIRYIDPKNSEAFADYEKMKYWLPVDNYFGGAEHTTMHLLYSRFWHKFFYDQKLVPTREPYKWRMNGGLLLGLDGTKMSKSKGNVMSPMNIVEKYGADALRAFICFIGPYTDTYPWNDNGIKATYRLATTIYGLQDKVTKEPKDSISEKLNKKYNRFTKNVTEMIQNLKMNTAISEIMVFVSELRKVGEIDLEIWKGFLKIIAPFMPFLAEDLWQKLGGYTEWDNETSVHLQKWPEFNEELAKKEGFSIGIQINGKIRDEIYLKRNASEIEAKKAVLEKEKVQKYLEGMEIQRFIYVPNKIVSILTK